MNVLLADAPVDINNSPVRILNFDNLIFRIFKGVVEHPILCAFQVDQLAGFRPLTCGNGGTRPLLLQV